MNDSQNRDIEKRARALEMLAKRYDQAGKIRDARDIRADDLDTEEGIAVDTIIAALAPPEGYVLVPVEPTREMLRSGAVVEPPDAHGQEYIEMEGAGRCWRLMLAARPKVSP